MCSALFLESVFRTEKPMFVRLPEGRVTSGWDLHVCGGLETVGECGKVVLSSVPAWPSFIGKQRLDCEARLRVALL